MKSLRWTVLVALLLSAASGAAWADRGHGFRGGHFGVGVFVGPVFGWPWYYAPPYYYYPPVVAFPAGPTAYIEQGEEEAPAPQALAPQDNRAWWYYCTKPQGYYPSVPECPGGWLKVAPQPPRN
jgi:hypothetical protein